ncbi:hypothetical protein XENOCAPTIV_023585 [Xenoophorus captivus]|uniref:Uncharacterized protein n=1 Tax=Xenoophorus captivus TaxID=1517983 RepID=A0ABV0S394_9TELE
MQTMQVIGGSIFCESGKNSMEDEPSEQTLPADTYTQCNFSKSISMTVRERIAARTESGLIINMVSKKKRSKTLAAFCLSPLATQRLEKQISLEFIESICSL